MANADRNIYLTGFMGAGKSTVGEGIARELARPFVDTDTIVEQKAGQSIPEIFASRGEDRFRELESRVVHDLAARHSLVVALGGGALMYPENLQRIHESGLLVYLDYDFDVLFRRIAAGTSRPLVQQLDEFERKNQLKKLFELRRKFYETAYIRVRCSADWKVEETIDKVLTKINEAL